MQEGIVRGGPDCDELNRKGPLMRQLKVLTPLSTLPRLSI
jgi:hypothetical protein